MKRISYTLYAGLCLLFLSFSAQIHAQCTVSQSIVCPGGVLGQLESGGGTFGTFSNSAEWTAIGKAPFPLPNFDFPYGVRIQRELSTTVYQIDQTFGNRKDVTLGFGDVSINKQSSEEIAKEPTRFDIKYLYQNQNSLTPSLTRLNAISVVPEFSNQININPPLSLACIGPVPCFTRTGINRTNPSFQLDVNGLLRVQGTLYASDKRLKKDVQNIDNAMDRIMKMQGTSYLFDAESNQDWLFTEGRKIGFIAQDLEEVVPEVVYTDKDGYKAVDYASLVPLLTEAIKDLNEEMQELKSQLQEARINNKTSSDSAAGALDIPTLFQNVPNPFNESTRIDYYLPSNVNRAEILVFDLTGRQVGTYDVSVDGKGSIEISGNSLDAGMYVYSLIADGKEVDTKRMILTR